ncbi:MAG: phage virion morphogenesis protein [Chitinophagales bacterium]|nr:phage virion morphogenesis protein [Chitinophagales bacterium]
MSKPTKQQIEQLLKKKLKRGLATLPTVIGTEAVSWFKDRFRQQNWVDRSAQPWAPRKSTGRKSLGRAILTNTGYLKRSPRIISTSANRARVGTNVPYAKVHNEGYSGTVTVNEHKRTTLFGKKVKPYSVPTYTRKMNIPRRRFIGNSYVLRSILNKRAKVHLTRSMR